MRSHKSKVERTNKVKRVLIFTFLASAILLAILATSYELNIEKLGGDASSGYRENGSFYVMNEAGEYYSVAGLSWYVNYTLILSLVFIGAVFGISGCIAVYIFLMLPAIRKQRGW